MINEQLRPHSFDILTLYDGKEFLHVFSVFQGVGAEKWAGSRNGRLAAAYLVNY